MENLSIYIIKNIIYIIKKKKIPEPKKTNSSLLQHIDSNLLSFKI